MSSWLHIPKFSHSEPLTSAAPLPTRLMKQNDPDCRGWRTSCCRCSGHDPACTSKHRPLAFGPLAVSRFDRPEPLGTLQVQNTSDSKLP